MSYKNKNKLSVFLVLDHAPDYRESFLQELCKYVNLTVVAQPCEQDFLCPPDRRIGYEYIELPTLRFEGTNWQPGLVRLLIGKSWDAICVDLNLRHLTRLYLYLKGRGYRKRWIWRGQIFGHNDNRPIRWVRRYLLKYSAGCLTYSQPIAQRVFDLFGVKAVSFNNTQVRQEDFRQPVFDTHSGLRLLFVGRNQPRKKLDRLISLAMRCSDVHVRLIGTGMESLMIPAELSASGRVAVIGRTIGKDLDPYFDWADLVASPGHVGLLVLNAAQHGKGIVIDNQSRHAPEFWPAKEAAQPFINFENEYEINKFIDYMKNHRWKLQEWGHRLQDVAKQKYSIEYMAQVHYRMFEDVATGAKPESHA